MANSIPRRSALVLLFATTLLAQTRRLLPVDESGRDPSLVAYLAKMKDAVSRQDLNALLPLIDPKIELSFGGDNGIANFHPDWALLARLVAMGGAWQEKAFCLPYVFAKFPDDLDPFDYAAITGQGVWLREAPAASARGMRQLNYEIVKVDDQGEEWWKVTTLAGEHGYVSARFIAGPGGYRAIIEKNAGGEWKMTALVAGD